MKRPAPPVELDDKLPYKFKKVRESESSDSSIDYHANRRRAKKRSPPSPDILDDIPKKYIKLDRKRHHSDFSDEIDEKLPKRSRREIENDHRPRYKRRYSGSDDGIVNKRLKIDTHDVKVIENQDRGRRDDLQQKIKYWKRLYQTEARKYKNLDKECKEKISELSAQLKEIKELDGDYELNPLSKSVINSVTIEDLNKIKMLLANNQMYIILRSRKYLRALQKLFVGLMYGIIPVTVSQRIALTGNERMMVKELENASIDRVKTYISSNREAFLNLFSVIDDSIKLVTKTYKRFGEL